MKKKLRKITRITVIGEARMTKGTIKTENKAKERNKEKKERKIDGKEINYDTACSVLAGPF